MTINPAELPHLAGLSTLAHARRTPDAKPKRQIATRLDTRKADDAREKREWARVQREVWKRENGRDRITGKRVEKTPRLQANRGECAHIVGRADQAVRFDRRNVILLSLDTHQRLDRNEIEIVGTRFFRVNGKRYINADFPITTRTPTPKGTL